jgi:hypothetical protein
MKISKPDRDAFCAELKKYTARILEHIEFSGDYMKNKNITMG